MSFFECIFSESSWCCRKIEGNGLDLTFRRCRTQEMHQCGLCSTHKVQALRDYTRSKEEADVHNHKFRWRTCVHLPQTRLIQNCMQNNAIYFIFLDQIASIFFFDFFVMFASVVFAVGLSQCNPNLTHYPYYSRCE
eukprot:TRINITY_DN2046_c0_g1_i1.p1 TRINITY_DN2046_c0_g1~~TRINITY_DN2046_c0_g1_i1.p1  ORF type:complete len:136 (+),score=10.09 TRINITY_DN2046_c0_g1_i1:407-814(+)